jgi:hypothetical protein
MLSVSRLYSVTDGIINESVHISGTGIGITILSTTDPTLPDLGLNPGIHSGKLVTCHVRNGIDRQDLDLPQVIKINHEIYQRFNFIYIF